MPEFELITSNPSTRIQQESWLLVPPGVKISKEKSFDGQATTERVTIDSVEVIHCHLIHIKNQVWLYSFRRVSEDKTETIFEKSLNLEEVNQTMLVAFFDEAHKMYHSLLDEGFEVLD